MIQLNLSLAPRHLNMGSFTRTTSPVESDRAVVDTISTYQHSQDQFDNNGRATDCSSSPCACVAVTLEKNTTHLTYIGARCLVGLPLRRIQLGPRHLAQLSTTMIALWNQTPLRNAYQHCVTPTGIYNALMQETTIAEFCDPFSMQ